MIAFTNHALDHLLTAVLDAGITSSIVRLGSRSADERISEYSLEHQERVAGKSRLDRAFARNHHELKSVEEELRETMEGFLRLEVETEQILKHLAIDYPEEYDYLTDNPPPWILPLYQRTLLDDGEGAWQQTGRNGRNIQIDKSLYAYWRGGHDLRFLQPPEPTVAAVHQLKPPAPTQTANRNQYSILSQENGTGEDDDIQGEDTSDISDDDSDGQEDILEGWKRILAVASRNQEATTPPLVQPSQEVQPKADPPSSPPILRQDVQISDLRDPQEYFFAFGLKDIPGIPFGDRPLAELWEEANPWQCSLSERQRLHMTWTEQVKFKLADSEQETFERLRIRHAEVLARYNEGKNEVYLRWQ